MSDSLKRTCLYDEHLALGAKMASFAGWEMPLHYGGILAEHRAVRSAAGLFDVSHMGRFIISGPPAAALLDKVLTVDIQNLAVGRARYGFLCQHDGGIIDDPVSYRLGQERFLLVCNAGNTDTVERWLRSVAQSFPGALVENVTDRTGMLAFQGPSTARTLDAHCASKPSTLPPSGCIETTVDGKSTTLARTGYTGEDGFELICDGERGSALWRLLLSTGAVPCGLGARDTLRLEACSSLYGNDMDTTTNPLEADLARFVRLQKPDFIGREAILAAQAKGIQQKLVAFQTLERSAVPRHGYTLLHRGKPAGKVTSGSYSPTLDRNIGLGYVRVGLDEPGTVLDVDVRGKLVPIEVVKKPFYHRSRGSPGSPAR